LCQRKEHFKIKNIKPVLTLATVVLKHVNIVLLVTFKNKM
jgi:hypothetical protein